MLLFCKLILAHILGDFVFQPLSWVKHKKKKGLKSGILYLHILIHGLLVYLFVQSWIIAVVVGGTHAIIDITKLLMQRESNRRQWFFYDQLSHTVVILGVVGWLNIDNAGILRELFLEHIYLITGLIFLTKPASIIIQNAISRWDPDPDDDSPDSLERAGAYIGVIERLFVFIFVLAGQWGALGFLIAAKSVFRFGDLKEANDRKLTEYILIGTLMSVGVATIVAAAVRYLS
ncbi:DUF3307 domain-containing protein [Fodinibius halophilus]|uniref:DUF3307 domain-containing protein n=1 Tax=Fodinibius halophilus TaxID=1736908 RepID=A0A6M1SSB7_9BACT|nr:DUF3307 domain-containing protein [Fodinibius halophilus]NGP86818.1 DUF3307 domain-containing protein [Fodinibius halophilus]